ncbi:hypothetical protein EV356DRAFT_512294 [Viridothelium virens]|uniref:Uncharacterized protein n=1 Tax=Viridothelium virens TaxID=1048519 RepID=A0A6A6HHT1_VIRVR|nr:hypothetical protein EV356DRAFT_512294 [Viridothelium virens]
MGQRHQLFVIARIAGRYRGLAAVHHQWLYGQGALKACLSLLKIFKEPLNRRVLYHELNQAKSLREEESAVKVDFQKIRVRFPFITTCLVLGASYDPASKYPSEVHLLPFNMAFDQGDNNDGVTIVDITEPTHPAYCFLAVPGCQVEAELMTPLRAVDYISAYLDSHEYPESVLKSFEHCSLISAESLHATWPRDEWNVGSGNSGKVDIFKSVSDEDDSKRGDETPSLRKMSLEKTIDECFKTSDLTAVLSEAKILPDFPPTIERRLRSRPDLIEQAPCGKQLLSMMLQGKIDVDLSPFTSLTDETTHQLMIDAQLAHTMKTLDLSGNPHVTGSLLMQLGKTCSALENIYLINTPQLPLNEAYSALQGKPNIHVIHSDAFHEAFRPVLPSETRIFHPQSTGDAFPPLVQILWVCSHVEKPPSQGLDGNSETPLASTATDSPGSWQLKQHFPISDPQDLCGCTVPLSDMRLSLKDTSELFVYFLDFVLSKDSITERDCSSMGGCTGTAVAKAFAMRGGAGSQVKPLPPRLYRLGKDCAHPHSTFFSGFEPVQEGDWTILVMGVADDAYKSMNYAFVTREKGTGKFLVLDFPGFVKRAGADAGGDAVLAWQKETALLRKRMLQTGKDFDVDVASEEGVMDLLLWVEGHKKNEIDRRVWRKSGGIPPL